MSTPYESFVRDLQNRTSLLVGTLAICLLFVAPQGLSPIAAQDRTEDDVFSTRSAIPKGVAIYKGRRVAMTMHYRGAEWLIRNEREREERCSLMLANLGIKPGMTVCDMGCGNGFYALQLAKMVGPRGQVLGIHYLHRNLSYYTPLSP